MEGGSEGSREGREDGREGVRDRGREGRREGETQCSVPGVAMHIIMPVVVFTCIGMWRGGLIAVGR